jgi:hypothetical protein
MTLARRPWVPAPSEDLVQSIAQSIVGQDAATLLARIDALAEKTARSTNATASTSTPQPT